jgi:hypothetical protein
VIGSMPEVGLGCFGLFEVEKVRDKMVVVGSPLHGVVYFSEW